MKLKTIIFMGRSGCGKGTQADLVAKFVEENDNRRIFKLEAGQRFRNFIAEDTYSSLLAREISDKGILQPEFLSVWAWGGEFISKMEKHDHLFIDGTPRRLREAMMLESALDFYQREDVEIVYINVSREWALSRMKDRGRADDSDENANSRLDWFDKDVVPAIDFYRAHKRHHFHEINGEQSIEKVHEDIMNALDFE